MPTLTTPPPERVGSPHAQDLVSCPSALSAASDAQQSAPSEQTFARVHAFTQLYTEQVGTVKGRRARIIELFPERLQPPSRQQTVKFPQFVTRSGIFFSRALTLSTPPLNLLPVSGDACRAAGLGSRQWCGRATHERTLIDSILCRIPPGHCAERPLGRTLLSAPRSHAPRGNARPQGSASPQLLCLRARPLAERFPCPGKTAVAVPSSPLPLGEAG